MGQYILEVMKNANQEYRDITFFIYERLEEPVDIQGASCYYRNVDSFIQLRLWEKKKEGYFNYRDFTEGDWSVTYQIQQDSIPLIMETAASLKAEFPGDYATQYNELVRRFSLIHSIEN